VLTAIRQQRHAAAVIGCDADQVELDKRLADARAEGAAGEALLLRGDPSQLPRLLAEQAGPFLRRHRQVNASAGVHPGGSIDLIVVFLPSALLLGPRQEPSGAQPRVGAVDLLTAAAVVLRPGGYLVAVTNSEECHGSGRDLGSETMSLCGGRGLRYWQHIVCLLATIDGDRLKPPHRSRRGRDVESRAPRVVHQNAHVFRKPEPAESQAIDQVVDSRRAA
jgi:hypothetical protein